MRTVDPTVSGPVYWHADAFRNSLTSHEDIYRFDPLGGPEYLEITPDPYLLEALERASRSVVTGNIITGLEPLHADQLLQPSVALQYDPLAIILAEYQRESRSVDVSSIEPTLQRVREIADLPADWDSYGGRETTAVAVAEVSQLLVHSLYFPFSQNNITVDAAPLPDGGVIVEWEAPARRLQIWVHGNGSRSGVVIEAEDGEDVNWIDLPDISDQDLIREYYALVSSANRV